MRIATRLLGLTLALGAGVGCEDDPPIPSGNLARPAGMAFVERPPAATVGTARGPEPLLRSDLLIADSEAQGVRIAQFVQSLNEDGLPEFLPAFFVPAPSALFKLAADAPGFPTQVSVSETPVSDDEAPPRAYVLAPATGQLHVLEVGNVAYQAPATVDTNVRVGSVDVGRVFEPSRIPVAIAYLGTGPSDAADRLRDFVLVAFDGLGADTGRLYLLAIELARDAENRVALAPAAESPVEVLGTVELPLGTSGLLARTDLGRALVSSVATSTVTEVEVVRDEETGAFVLGPARSIEAGGPTLGVVSLGDDGALALRADRSAVTWLPFTRFGRFERAAERLPSPYDDPDPDAPSPEPGVLALRQPGPAAAAHGRLTQLGLPAPFRDEVLFRSEEARDVVLVVHDDARATYILGGVRPQVALGEEGLTIRAAYPSDFVEGDPVLGLADEGACGAAAQQCLALEDDSEAFCSREEVQAIATGKPFVGNETFRVSPRGTLFEGFNLAFLGRQLTSTATAVRADLVDTLRPSAVPFRIRTGDRVRAVLRLVCGDEDRLVDALLEGPVVSMGTGLDPRGTVVRSGMRITADLTTVTSSVVTGDPTSETFLELCADDLLDRAVDALDVEVHVPDDVDEAVYAQVSSETVERVLERVPMEIDPLTGRVEIPLGEAEDSPSPFRFRVEGLPSAATCETVSRADPRTILVGTEPVGVLGFCRAGPECGIGRACVGSSGRCPGACEATCTGLCFQDLEDRVCPRLDLEISGPGVVIDLAAAPVTGGGNVRSGAAPADAVFHPQRGSFFVSLPGARTVVELPTVANARLVRLR